MGRRTERAGDVAERGRRVVLRRPRPADRAEYLALVRESAAFLAPWELRIADPDGTERFRRLLDAWRHASSRKFLVCRRADGALLGGMNLNNVVHGVFRNAALGYWIGAPHAREGYATEALALALRHAFVRMRLHRVEINCLPRNVASKRLARRAGFRREGLSRRYVRIAGRWQDHERYALLVEDWRAARSARAPRRPRSA